MAIVQVAHAGYPELDGSETAQLWTASETYTECNLRSLTWSFEWTTRGLAMKAADSTAVSEEEAAAGLQRLRDAGSRDNARVAAAMFDACIAAKKHPRPLDAQKQAAIITGPQAPRFLVARESPEGCSLQSTYLLGDAVEMIFDVASSGSRILFSRVPTFTQPAQPNLQIDLSALGGPVRKLEDGIAFQLSPDMAAALRTDLAAGDPRILRASAGKQLQEQFAFGSRVNDTAIAMFSACLTARGL